MRVLVHVVATLALTARGAFAETFSPTTLGKEGGGPHGDWFTDLDDVVPGMKVRSVFIRGAERIDAIGMTIVKPSGEERTFRHGGYGGTEQSWDLADGEYIKRVAWTTDTHKGRTRIFWLEYLTNTGRKLSLTPYSDESGSYDYDLAPPGFQLGGFVGGAGKEIDRLQPIWTCVTASCS
ncbi:hypothetical protein PsorP6_010933 [Peronosclerospora sorghi]|uniref:Uncharacterized protein n=1 Tax=Peronosclerospora sorghi TaxID=230839 RepID=A0ACC0VYV9_9STRA|nr:hypothetical protein PsorP6_010933 [Peronosclerospora sorghi]